MTQLLNHHILFSMMRVNGHSEQKNKSISHLNIGQSFWNRIHEIYSFAVGFGRIQNTVLPFSLSNYIDHLISFFFWFHCRESYSTTCFSNVFQANICHKKLLARSPALPHAARSVHVESTSRPHSETRLRRLGIDRPRFSHPFVLKFALLSRKAGSGLRGSKSQ